MSKLNNIAGLLMTGDIDMAIDKFVDGAYAKLIESTAWPRPTVDEPDVDELEDWMNDAGCEATDGCWVEPDGVCSHGHPSWLIKLGLI